MNGMAMQRLASRSVYAKLLACDDEGREVAQRPLVQFRELRELHDVDAPLAALRLADVGLRAPELRGDLALGKPSRLPRSDESPPERLIVFSPSDLGSAPRRSSCLHDARRCPPLLRDSKTESDCISDLIRSDSYHLTELVHTFTDRDPHGFSPPRSTPTGVS